MPHLSRFLRGEAKLSDFGWRSGLPLRSLRSIPTALAAEGATRRAAEFFSKLFSRWGTVSFELTHYPPPPTLARDARACPERSRRDGAPSVGMVHATIVKGGPPATSSGQVRHSPPNPAKYSVSYFGTPVTFSRPLSAVNGADAEVGDPCRVAKSPLSTGWLSVP